MLLKLPISYSFQNFLKFLPIILKLFTYHHLLFLYYSYNFDCVNDNNVHNAYDEYYTGEEGVCSADISSEFALLPSCSPSFSHSLKQS